MNIRKPSGGCRPGAGRPKGVPNVITCPPPDDTHHDSRHSHDSFQISLGGQEIEAEEEKKLNRGDAVNPVNAMNAGPLEEEVIEDAD